MQNNPTFTMLAAEALSRFRLVQEDGTYADDNVAHDAVGVTTQSIANAAYGPCRYPTAGEQELTASGAIAKGARVYQDDDGKVKALPGSGATDHIRRGVALEAASADGDIIRVNPTGWGSVDTAPA